MVVSDRIEQQLCNSNAHLPPPHTCIYGGLRMPLTFSQKIIAGWIALAYSGTIADRALLNCASDVSL